MEEEGWTMKMKKVKKKERGRRKEKNEGQESDYVISSIPYYYISQWYGKVLLAHRYFVLFRGIYTHYSNEVTTIY